MSAPIPETVSPSKIPEVKAFLKAKAALDELRETYPKAFAQLLELAPVYNTALEAAAEATKERRCSSGPFDLYSFSTKYSATKLYAAVGRQKFAQCGGLITSGAELLDVEKKRFEALAAAGKITPEIVEAVVSYTPSFHKPAPISIP